MLSPALTQRINEWLEAAKVAVAVGDYNAMSLATSDSHGQPSVRIVLLKGFDARGFVFYTNLHSRKSEELRQNAKASLCFHWPALGRQLRVDGHVETVSAQEADAYFATRPRGSQIGAWSSHQSQVLPERGELLAAIDEHEKRFEGADVPRPEFWSGWRVKPHAIEFWHSGDFRIHERELYTHVNGGWQKRELYP